MTSVDGCQASQPRIKATLESSGHLFLVDTGSSVAKDASQLVAIHPTPNQSTAPTSTPESAGNGPVIDLSHIGDTERQQLQELIDELTSFRLAKETWAVHHG